MCPGPVTSEITLHAFTGTANKSVGHPQEDSIVRMTAERCAALYAAAMWKGLPEVWVSPQPMLLYAYVAQVRRPLLPPAVTAANKTRYK